MSGTGRKSSFLLRARRVEGGERVELTHLESQGTGKFRSLDEAVAWVKTRWAEWDSRPIENEDVPALPAEGARGRTGGGAGVIIGLRSWRERAGSAWARANNTARATVAGILVVSLVGGTILATSEDAQRALSDATGLVAAGSSNPTISTETGEPAVFPVADHLEYFVRGQDNKLWRRSPDATGSGWHWSQLASPPLAYSAPAVASLGGSFGSDPRTYLFVKGQDSSLWVRKITSTSYEPWVSLGGYLTSSPAAAWVQSSTGHDLLYVYVKGGDDQFYYRTMTLEGVWSDYVPTGGVFTSAPSIASRYGFAYVFGRGMDNAIWVQEVGFTSWTSLGGVFTSGPSAVGVRIAGSLFADTEDLYVFGRGADNAIYYRRGSGSSIYAAVWDGGWSSLSGQFTSGPSTNSRGSGLILDVNGRGTDGKIYRRSLIGSSWTASWTPLP